MEKANPMIRKKMQAHKIPQWKVAEKLGVHEKTLQGWLRTPLDQERKSEVIKAIDAIIGK